MNAPAALDDDHADDGVDATIRGCLSLDSPTSFFVFAGAGSGKTRSLVSAIEDLRINQRRRLLLKGQRIGVITYTNAACDEIKRRVNFDPLVEVSTIHSFVWKLIEGFDDDIRAWLAAKLNADLEELQQQQSRSRGPNQTSLDRAEKIESKRRRLGSLQEIKRFTYNPNGENSTRDSLNHSEVIGLAASFLRSERLLQEILVTRFPLLLVDESQDTDASLLEALMEAQKCHRKSFALGLFGDQMQRIYTAGKADLDQSLPDDWKKPSKVMNHRCPHRIVDLINRIRSAVDNQVQRARSDSRRGSVCLFIAPSDTPDKMQTEAKVAATMADLTGDEKWRGDGAETKRLILEHHMAARRMGFHSMFEPLYRSAKLSTGVLDGSLSELKFFSECIAPVVSAKLAGDEFAVASVVRSRSPLVSKRALEGAGDNQMEKLREADAAVSELCALWSTAGDPTFRQVLEVIARNGLFAVPTGLRHFANPRGTAVEASDDEGEEPLDTLDAWQQFLDARFEEIRHYQSYIEGRAGFDTHQGVKGLEFPRVMVVMDDAEARGFLFSYEKLFGAKERSKTDVENERQGKDTGIARTRRLFYVTCSRARESLALVAYSANPSAVRAQVLTDGWFGDDEVVVIQ